MQFRKQFKTSIIAHRGYRQKYPENTLLSFQKAIDLKADYIELDVHLTADKELVVCHNRSTGERGDKNYVIQETSLEKLEMVDMGQGQKIPTLQEVIDLCKGKIGLQIEIKRVGVAEKLVSLIKENNLMKETLCSSFWHNELARIKAINPEMNCGLLEPSIKSAVFGVISRSWFIHNAKKVQAQAIHPWQKLITKSFCQKAHAQNLLINAWTVDNPADWKHLIDIGVDGIITNRPDQLYTMLSQMQ